MQMCIKKIPFKLLERFHYHCYCAHDCVNKKHQLMIMQLKFSGMICHLYHKYGLCSYVAKLEPMHNIRICSYVSVHVYISITISIYYV